jgi:hypothetical protein
LFKRRKPDEVPTGSGATLPAGVTVPSNVADNAATQTVVHPASPRGSPSGPADTGLGVPPFRPAPPKEAQPMSRPPLSPAPSPLATPPASGARPGLPPVRSPAREPGERRTLVVGRGISLQGTGRVLGTARCRRLQVEDGGQITGRMEMITDQAKTDLPRPVATEPAA